MSPAGDGGEALSRSQIETWDTTHLEQAATRWRTTATEIEEHFEQLRQHVVAPGGTEWEGDAKDAALDRATRNLNTVRAAGDIARSAADQAENSTADINAAKRDALQAISDAEADGFEVTEDLAVRDTRRVDVSTMAARYTAAREHTDDISWRADQLVQTDSLAGRRLTEKATELNGIRFDDESSRDGTIQAASFGDLKQGGGDGESKTDIPGPKPPPPTDSGQAAHGSQPWYSRVDDVLFEKVAEEAADAAEAQGWTHAADHLRHYLGNSGDDLTVNPDEIQRDVPSIQQTTNAIVNDEVQRIAAEAASTGKYGAVPFQSDWIGVYIGPDESKDWFYAMGGLQQSVTGVVTVHPPSVPGGEPTVTADYQTHVFDRYNWDGTKTTTFDVPGTDGVTVSDARMGALHTAGLAQEYNISGSGSVHHYDGPLSSNAPLDLPAAPDNRDGTRSDLGRHSPWEYGPERYKP